MVGTRNPLHLTSMSPPSRFIHIIDRFKSNLSIRRIPRLAMDTMASSTTVTHVLWRTAHSHLQKWDQTGLTLLESTLGPMGTISDALAEGWKCHL